MEVIQGHSKNFKVFLDARGFLWLLNKTTASATYYRCHTEACTATSVMVNGLHEQRRPHNHIVDSGAVDELRFKTLLRELAATTSRGFRDIFGEAQRTHEEGALRAGGLHECTAIMKCARAEQTPKVPKTLGELHAAMQLPG